MVQEFTTKKGVKVAIKNCEKDGLSLRWRIELGGGCCDVGETIPTNFKFKTKKDEKSHRRITDEQVVNDLFNKIKSKKWLFKLDFTDVSQIIYKHLKELYGNDCFRYYETTYID
jgi:hypothetical protein